MQTSRLVLFTIATALALSACGNKGPLVLPEKPAEPAPASESPPATVPETPAATPATPTDATAPTDAAAPQDEGSMPDQAEPGQPPQDDGAPTP